MSERVKNIVIVLQSILLLIAVYYLYLSSTAVQPVAVIADTRLPLIESSVEPVLVLTSAVIKPEMDQQASAPAETQTPAPSATLSMTDTENPLQMVLALQKLADLHQQQDTDYEWATYYQQQLSDWFVTEQALRGFRVIDIECKTSSCRLLLDITTTEEQVSPQQRLAFGLNQLKLQQKIGVYQLSQHAEQQIQLILQRPAVTAAP